MGGSGTPGTLENGRSVDVGTAPSPPSHRLGQGNGRPSPHGEDGMRAPSNARAAGPETVSWRDLPRKDQLCVITLARLSEPLVQTSIQSYMFYQLKWFGPTLSDAVISGQAGILHASFTAAQFLTAMLWGRIADSGRVGRKTVLMIGLAGTLLSCVGFAFSTSFAQALFFRSIGGITNGNVGVLRTMISETVKEKKYQSRAFLLLPMTFNVGVIIGPILGGILSDPAGSYPDLFGHIDFFRSFPYATPNLVAALFLLCGLVAVWLWLEETLDSRVNNRDRGLELGQKLRKWLFSGRSGAAYTRLASQEVVLDLDDSGVTGMAHSRQSLNPEVLQRPKQPGRRYTQRLAFRRIFTPNVIWTLIANFLMTFQLGTFNSLWFVFLSTPVYDPQSNSPVRQLPFIFTGGLGLRPPQVGLAVAILGVFGLCLQVGVYPWLSTRLGTIGSWRLFLLFPPLTYFLVPYLSIVPSASPPPHPKDGVTVWVAIVGVLLLQVLGRTFTLPAQTILVNNCTPHPSVLGSVHGIGQSVSSFARAIGPILGGFLYGLGLAKGVVGAVFWCLSGVAVCNIIVSWFVREGNGHEIWLEGDKEEEDGY